MESKVCDNVSFGLAEQGRCPTANAAMGPMLFSFRESESLSGVAGKALVDLGDR